MGADADRSRAGGEHHPQERDHRCLVCTKLRAQPGLGQTHLPVDAIQRDAKSGPTFFRSEAAEESHFQNAGLFGILHGEKFKGIVERDNRCSMFTGEHHVVFERHTGATASLFRVARACPVDENLTHETGGHPEEVCAVIKIRILSADEAQIGFMHEGGGIERLRAVLAMQGRSGEAAELAIDEGNQCVERVAVAIPPLMQQDGDRGVVLHCRKFTKWLTSREFMRLLTKKINSAGSARIPQQKALYGGIYARVTFKEGFS